MARAKQASMIHLVTFDALHTLVTPRVPIHLKYSQIFEPYFGKLDPNGLKVSFKKALKHAQVYQPVYRHGAEEYWRLVIKTTAEGAGAEEAVVNKALPEIVPRLLEIYSSKKGYKLFDDTLPTLLRLNENGVKTGLVSNADARMLDALIDLEIYSYLQPIIISEKEGLEKPNPGLFRMACERTLIPETNAVHVGDDLVCDYRPAKRAGMTPLLLRRKGPEGEAADVEEDEELSKSIRTVESLSEVADWVLENNS